MPRYMDQLNALPLFAAAGFGAAMALLSMYFTRFLRLKGATYSFRSVYARMWFSVDRIYVNPWLYRFGRGVALEELVAVAGLSPAWTAQRFLALKKFTIFTSAALALWIIFRPTPLAGDAALTAGLLVGVGWFWPELYLRRYIALRKKRIQKMLAYVIDLLRLQVGAGFSLESSFRSLAHSMRGEWNKELTHTIFLLDHGVAFDDAFRQLADRIALEDLNRFVLAVRQSQRLGASLTETLAIQAEMLRTRRRQRAEERARLAAVKIALPLVFFIFPALLIIYLAPAVLRIVQLF